MLGFGDRRNGPLRRRPSRRLLASVIALGALVSAGLGACTTSSSTAIPPTTGILIRSETLTSGRGCGTSPTQMYKYAVVVFGYGSGDAGDPASYSDPIASNVFDCFTDGVFISVPTPSGNPSFRLEVFAYNEPAYTASRADVDTATVFDRALPDKLRQTSPTWTTECRATQQENVQALASCGPLAPDLAGLGGGTAGATKITLATSTFHLTDGRIATCGPSPVEDGGIDASDDGGTDAGADASDASDDAATPEAGAPITFAKVRVRPRVGANVVGPTVDIDCPSPYVAAVGAEPTRYELDVALLDSAGNLVETAAQTVCTVTSQPGTTSSAVCP